MREEHAEASQHLREWTVRNNIAPADVERVLTGLKTLERGDHPGTLSGVPDPTCPVPGLTSRPWWKPSSFPWAARLLAEAKMIREEYSTASSRLTRSEALRNPAESGRLRASGRWTTVQLYHLGQRQALADSFPVTVASLQRIAEQPCGMVFFSTLEPRSTIDPHTGYTNAHLRVHLVIRPNEGARFRVADEWRSWKDHELLVFDDTFEHEAVNEDDDERVVLLFDIWHPDLSEVERMAFQEAMDHLRKARARQHLLNALANG
jgi:aspartyl/asparaginyl beta-hydroxylase (cupin superfamily)